MDSNATPESGCSLREWQQLAVGLQNIRERLGTIATSMERAEQTLRKVETAQSHLNHVLFSHQLALQSGAVERPSDVL